MKGVRPTDSMRLALLFAACFFGTLVTGNANPVRWTLSNLNVKDGSSINGYFVFDADVGSPPTGLTDFRISVSGGSLLPDFLYEPANPFSQVLIYSFRSTGGPQEVINAFRGRAPAGTAFELLYLDPVSFLSNEGGTVPLDLVKSSAQLSDGETTVASSLLSRGSLVGVPAAAVPEPKSFLIIVVGGLLLAIAKLRKFSSRLTSRQVTDL